MSLKLTIIELSQWTRRTWCVKLPMPNAMLQPTKKWRIRPVLAGHQPSVVPLLSAYQVYPKLSLFIRSTQFARRSQLSLGESCVTYGSALADLVSRTLRVLVSITVCCLMSVSGARPPLTDEVRRHFVCLCLCPGVIWCPTHSRRSLGDTSRICVQRQRRQRVRWNQPKLQAIDEPKVVEVQESPLLALAESRALVNNMHEFSQQSALSCCSGIYEFTDFVNWPSLNASFLCIKILFGPMLKMMQEICKSLFWLSVYYFDLVNIYHF